MDKTDVALCVGIAAAIGGAVFGVLTLIQKNEEKNDVPDISDAEAEEQVKEAIGWTKVNAAKPPKFF